MKRLVVAMALLVACSSHDDAGHEDHGGEVTPPTGAPTDASEMPTAEDQNPDPNVVEIDLEAKEAMKTYGTSPPTPVWTYNGLTPGPTIEAKVGDRLVVHFKNSLPESTTVHWHGIRLPAVMDGTVAMQSPIEPGGTFTYEFTLKDAGLFWFHPHVRSDLQVQKGLYGALRVRATWAAIAALWMPGFFHATEARSYTLLFLLGSIQAILFLRLLTDPSRRRACA